MKALEFRNNLIELLESLMRYAYNLTNSKDLSQDLVQETILKALANREKFIDDSNLKGWVFTIMKNTFINEYRRCKQQNIYCERNYEALYFNNTRSICFSDPSSVYCASELVNSIEQLQEPYRKALKLRIKGYKYEEIAEELDLNIGTVKSRIFLSRKKLLEKMSK
ncbi:MAG: RNA polymerase subunit sigma [Bacteroidetes bacterium HGW-Bacteroidetes-12]|nr:MAG: RNA polymerase subunit sigma [Bacteroidetes bacterium HGW-Bacteroidetes-12]